MAMLGGWRLTRTGILFVIGVVVLAGLVFGGIVLVRQRGEQVRRDEAVKVAEQNLKEQSEVATVPADESSASESEAEAAAAQEAAENAAGSNAAASATGQLPETGPADDFGRIIAVTILATSVAFYVSSRRSLVRG